MYVGAPCTHLHASVLELATQFSNLCTINKIFYASLPRAGMHSRGKAIGLYVCRRRWRHENHQTRRLRHQGGS